MAIVAPASQLRTADRRLLVEAVDLLRAWDLKPQLRVDSGHHFYLAGNDLVRGEHLRYALSDPRIRAIFCLRGGYGSARILTELEFVERPSEKVLVGYSDFTAVQAAAGRLWSGVESIYGPNVATSQLLASSGEATVSRRSLHDCLFDPNYEVIEAVEFLRDGKGDGPLVGGCLTLLVSLLGTRYMPNTEGSLLFLEDTGEPPYRIDRMLTQLILAGVFNEVRGVVFGAMPGCADPYNDLREVITDVLRGGRFPIAFGLKSGHGPVNLSLRLNSRAELDSKSSTFCTRAPGRCW